MIRIQNNNNTLFLQLALQLAAERAYKEEIIDAEMYEFVIGPSNDFANQDEWMQGRIESWVKEVKDKYKEFTTVPVIEVSEKSILAAYAFHHLIIGESAKLNKDTTITRVPGGWMWTDTDKPIHSVFIPKSDEFKSILNKGTDDGE